jgi:mRNA interferase RelE/StbE
VYKLFLHPNVEKQLSNIPTPYAKRIADAIRALRSEPRPPGCKHLSQELYRVRVGEYRIIFAVFDQEQVIFVGKVARRSEKVYRDVAAILSTARKSVRKD